MSSITRTENPVASAPYDAAARGRDCDGDLSVIEFELSALGVIEFELSDEELLPSRPGASNRVGLAPPRATAAAHLEPWGYGAIAVALTISLAALACGIARHQPSSSVGRTEIAMNTRGDKPNLSASFSRSTSRPLPVRFANPFDATEVFEFPPGTSREYARETVAEFLIDRARSRHAAHVQRSRMRREIQDS